MERTEVFSDFTDGQMFMSNPLFQDNGKRVAALQIYYDDIEITNPIGTKTGIHKLGMFYFSIKNLPSFYNRTMANIHLVAAVRSEDLKTYGYAEILDEISDEIIVLQTHGIDLNIDKNLLTLFASLAVVTGDNLGRNALLGLVESFNAGTHSCPTCLTAMGNDIQLKHNEEDFQSRTVENYNEHLAYMAKEKNVNNRFGIKLGCPLNAVNHWHMVNNKAADLMHDALEGVGPYSLKLILHSLIFVDKLFDCQRLNSRVVHFPTGPTDRNCKPSELKEHQLKNPLNTKTNIGQKAMQFWCLLRLLPLMIGHLVPENNKFWKFYLELRDIFDILFQQKWTIADCDSFKKKYSEHLKHFLELFSGNEDCTLFNGIQR